MGRRTKGKTLAKSWESSGTPELQSQLALFHHTHKTISGEAKPSGARPVATTIKKTQSRTVCLRLHADSQCVQRMEGLARLGTRYSTQAEPFLRMHRMKTVAFHGGGGLLEGKGDMQRLAGDGGYPSSSHTLCNITEKLQHFRISQSQVETCSWGEPPVTHSNRFSF